MVTTYVVPRRRPLLPKMVTSTSLILPLLLGLLLVCPGWAQTDDDLDDLGDAEDGLEDGEGEGDSGGTGEGAMGAVKLDNMTFDKVVGLPGFTTLVKFDSAYPYGEKEDEFKALCPLAYSVPNFFIGEVQIPDHGDRDNDDLRQRFNLKSEDFPVYLLFKGPNNMIKYSGEVTTADISSWLRSKGVKISALGTIVAFDEIAMKFATGQNMDAHIQEAQKLQDEEYKDDPMAAMYLKIMRTAKQKGIGYITTELARVEKVLAGRVSEAKRKEFTQKVRILGMFVVQKDAEEL